MLTGQSKVRPKRGQSGRPQGIRNMTNCRGAIEVVNLENRMISTDGGEDPAFRCVAVREDALRGVFTGVWRWLSGWSLRKTG
jgi:hypothetical protein